MSDDTYNGWTNRETWALNLWLENDQGLSEMTRERVKGAVYAVVAEARIADEPPVLGWAAADAVKDLWEELTDPDEERMGIEMLRNILRDVGSEWRVNWLEIGAAWLLLSDLDES